MMGDQYDASEDHKLEKGCLKGDSPSFYMSDLLRFLWPYALVRLYSVVDEDDVFWYCDYVSVFWAEDFSDFRAVLACQGF